MLRATRSSLLSTLLLLLAAPVTSWGQTGLATLTGLATDNTGAAVPGVTVTATNQATNVDYTGISNEAGAYVITGVPIGEYVLRSELTGFKTVQSNVALSAGQTARVDFKLEVGAVEERLEVVATGAVLQTENAVVGQTMQREQVEKLPVQGATWSPRRCMPPASRRRILPRSTSSRTRPPAAPTSTGSASRATTSCSTAST
jgi:Carboxypeptidase regulatory-like domain